MSPPRLTIILCFYYWPSYSLKVYTRILWLITKLHLRFHGKSEVERVYVHPKNNLICSWRLSFIYLFIYFCLSVSTKKYCWELDGNCIKPIGALDISTLLSLLINEHSMSLQVFRSLDFFRQHFVILSHRSDTCFLKFIPKYLFSLEQWYCIFYFGFHLFIVSI